MTTLQKSVLAILCFMGMNMLSANAQQTIIKYLSGKDKDHTVAWDFYCTGGRHSEKWTTIPVPSCWELQGFGTYNYGHDEKRTHRKVGHEKGLYKYRFSVPDSWKGKIVNIVFEGSMTDTKVKINKKQAGPVHQGAFYRFKYNITDLLRYGSENLLEVTVNKVSSNASVNRAERQADFWIFGGIFRPVYLEVKPKQHIERIAIDARAKGMFTAQVYLKGQGSAVSISGQIETLDGTKVGNLFTKTIDKQASYQTLSTRLRQVQQWSPEFPHLYVVELYLKDKKGRTIHKVEKRFGFRTIEVRSGDGIYINGKKIRFKGVDYHSFWPSSGRTLSKALVIKDINLIKDMNMNAVRLSHYPRASYFYDVCDSLGLFVADELTGWQAAYDTVVGRKLVKEMVINDVNHPSVVMWNNGNEGGYNFALDQYFKKWDPQKRPVNHPGSIFKNFDSQHYPSIHSLEEKFLHEHLIIFPDEFMHGLYDGGGGAGLQDIWQLMRGHSRSAGGFIWDYADGCVVRTDKNDSLDCDDNHDADGILGPYREKEGSFYAIKAIWSPVQIQQLPISKKKWNEKLSVENRYFFTNLKQVKFEWTLLDYPGPFEESDERKITDKGDILSPDIAPQSSGFIQLHLPPEWRESDALKITATDPHGREIYQWTFPIKDRTYWINRSVPEADNTALIKQTDSSYILTSGSLAIQISKKSGYILGVRRSGNTYSFKGGPFIVGDSSSLKEITQEGKTIHADFAQDGYEVNYSIHGEWLKIDYSYRPKGSYPFFGVGFNYPEQKVEGIRWLGHGPDRVWKNRLAGMELGLWSKKHKKYPGRVAIHGYHWHKPKFNGYYADLYWAVLQTTEGPITMMVTSPGIYLGLLQPRFPLHPGKAKANYPQAGLSFLHAISPIGSKFHNSAYLGPAGLPNLFEYGYATKGHLYKYRNTLWLNFGSR